MQRHRKVVHVRLRRDGGGDGLELDELGVGDGRVRRHIAAAAAAEDEDEREEALQQEDGGGGDEDVRPSVHHSSGTVTGPPTVIGIAEGERPRRRRREALEAVGDRRGPSLPAATAVVSSPP